MGAGKEAGNTPTIPKWDCAHICMNKYTVSLVNEFSFVLFILNTAGTILRDDRNTQTLFCKVKVTFSAWSFLFVWGTETKVLLAALTRSFYLGLEKQKQTMQPHENICFSNRCGQTLIEWMPV